MSGLFFSSEILRCYSAFGVLFLVLCIVVVSLDSDSPAPGVRFIWLMLPLMSEVLKRSRGCKGVVVCSASTALVSFSMSFYVLAGGGVLHVISVVWVGNHLDLAPSNMCNCAIFLIRDISCWSGTDSCQHSWCSPEAFWNYLWLFTNLFDSHMAIVGSEGLRFPSHFGSAVCTLGSFTHICSLVVSIGRLE